MPVVDIPFGPAGPRRPGGPRRVPPHPASGRAPDMMDILAEAGTLRPPSSDQLPITPEEQGLIEGMVNDPRAGNIPPGLLEPEALGIAVTHGATGSMPALRRTLIESLSDMVIKQLDIEAAVNPTLGRELAKGPGLATMDELMGGAKGHGRLSDFFLGASPIDNPDKIQAAIDEIRAGVERLRPDIEYGYQTAILENVAEQGNRVTPAYDKDIMNRFQRGEGNATSIEDLLTDLERILAMSSEPDPRRSQDMLLQIINEFNPDIVPEDKIRRALMDATELSNIGSGQRVAGMDPTTQASLAPDFDPGQLRNQLQNRGGTADVDLIMRMMGMDRTIPRGGV